MREFQGWISTCEISHRRRLVFLLLWYLQSYLFFSFFFFLFLAVLYYMYVHTRWRLVGWQPGNWRTMEQALPSCLGWHLPLVDRILGKYMVWYSLVAKWVVWRVVWERERSSRFRWLRKTSDDRQMQRTGTKVIGKHDSVWWLLILYWRYLTCLRRFLLIVLYWIRTGLFSLNIRFHFGIGSSYSTPPTCPICYDRESNAGLTWLDYFRCNIWPSFLFSLFLSFSSSFFLSL